jgi:2-oxoglutarate ferredoxin oxidoreductase subunit gamma
MELKRILIAGEGGQGIQSMAHILTRAAFSEGKQVTFLPNFGIEQRGGVSLAFIQISDKLISFPKFQSADILVVLTKRAIKRIEKYVIPETILMFDNSLIGEADLAEFHVEKVAIPASYCAKEKLVPKVFNIIMLGALTKEIGSIASRHMEKQIEEFFADKIKEEPQLKHFNLRALELGEDMMKGIKKHGR